MINSADEFIIFDEAQYTKNDWRNRNQIKTANGLLWLTIPVRRHNLQQKVCETRISDKCWRKKHWKTLQGCYARTPGFKLYKTIFEELYMGSDEVLLSNINVAFICAICALLDIKTTIVPQSGVDFGSGKTERLIEVCKTTNADTYLSGPAAKNYLDEDLFEKSGISLEYMDYSGYEEYSQPYPPFAHNVSILDVLFNCGKDSPRYYKKKVD